MKILQVINSFGRGGAQRLVRDLAIELNKRNIDVEVCVLSSNVDIYSSELRELKIQVHEVSVTLYDTKALGWFRENLKNYDLVHVHLFPSLYWVSLASRLSVYSGKLVFTEHSTYNRRRKYTWLRPIDQWFYEPYDLIVNISISVEEALHKWLSKMMNISIVIENGIDIKRFLEANPAQISNIIGHSTNDLVLVLMVASFRQSKDQKTLVLAMKWLPENYHLLLVGCGSQEVQVKEITAKYSLKNRVHFLGFRTDIPEIMKACDVYVQSSKWEGFGLVAVEAMAANLPVVASDVEGLAEVVGAAGLLFEPGNSQELAERITEAFSRREILSKIGQYQADKFGMNRFIESHITLYKHLYQKTEI